MSIFESQLPAKIQEQGLMPVQDLATFNMQLSKFQEIVKSYLQAGTDYGKIPGTTKDTLFKPGAEKLCEIYGFYADFAIEQQIENWDKVPELFDYTVKCTIKRRNDDKVMGTAIGSCNSYEGKYKWRDANRNCPKCAAETIFKAKEDKGGGWYCWTKKGGCGAQFTADDKSITAQLHGKVPNVDVATQKNTVLKMAQKRALVSAAVASTRSSGIFTVDVEDFIETEIKVSELVREPIIQDIVDTETGEVIRPSETRTNPADTPLSTAEFVAFMRTWEEKGFPRASLLQTIFDNCKEEGVSLATINKKFTYKLCDRVIKVLNEKMARETVNV